MHTYRAERYVEWARSGSGEGDDPPPVDQTSQSPIGLVVDDNGVIDVARRFAIDDDLAIEL